MRIKTLFCGIFLAGFASSVTAQNYPPLLKNTCWYVYDWALRIPPVKHIWVIPDGDTVISSRTYIKYIDSGRARLAAMIREDVSQKKVYAWDKFYNADELLFDFSLQLNNIFTYRDKTYRVTNVDSVTSQGIKRRRLTLNSIPCPGGYCDDIWVEGVGNTRYPVLPEYALPRLGADQDFRVECAYQNGIPIYSNIPLNPNCNPDCCPTPPVVGNNKSILKKWYPNPLTSTSTFLTDKSLTNATLFMYNAFGQLVQKVNNISGYTITLKRNILARGIYFVQIVEDGVIFASNTLLISDQ